MQENGLVMTLVNPTKVKTRPYKVQDGTTISQSTIKNHLFKVFTRIKWWMKKNDQYNQTNESINFSKPMKQPYFFISFIKGGSKNLIEDLKFLRLIQLMPELK